MEQRLPAIGHRVEVTVVRVEVIEPHVILSAMERNPHEGQQPGGYISVYDVASEHGQRALKAKVNDRGALIFTQNPDSGHSIVDTDNLVDILTRLSGTSGGYWEYFPDDAPELK
jgi:hypothetical protein